MNSAPGPSVHKTDTTPYPYGEGVAALFVRSLLRSVTVNPQSLRPLLNLRKKVCKIQLHLQSRQVLHYKS